MVLFSWDKYAAQKAADTCQRPFTTKNKLFYWIPASAKYPVPLPFSSRPKCACASTGLHFLFCDNFRFTCRNKCGIAVVCSNDNQHPKFIPQDGSLGYCLTAGIDADTRGADRQVTPNRSLTVRIASRWSGRRPRQISDVIVIRFTGYPDRSNSAQRNSLFRNTLRIGQLEQSRRGVVVRSRQQGTRTPTGVISTLHGNYQSVCRIILDDLPDEIAHLVDTGTICACSSRAGGSRCTCCACSSSSSIQACCTRGLMNNKKTNYQIKYGYVKPLRNGCWLQ